MADAEENPHPEDEHIEADLLGVGDPGPVQDENQAEEDGDEDAGGNGFPGVEADQASQEESNLGNSLDGVDLGSAASGGEEIALAGNGVPEAEADQGARGDSDNNELTASASGGLLSAGNGYPEVEADQLPATEKSDENSLGLEVGAQGVCPDLADADLREYKTEDDQASPCDNPDLPGSVAVSDAPDPDLRTEDDQGAVSVCVNPTENLGQSVEYNSEENLESDFPAEADLNPPGESSVPLDVNCDNSSTESEVKIEEDLEAVDQELAGGYDAEADTGDGLGHVLETVAESASSDCDGDSLHQVLDAASNGQQDSVGVPQASGSGTDVSFEPECDQGPSDNSAHSSQIFCDDDIHLDEVRHEGEECVGLEMDVPEEGGVKNDTDQPEDMIGACVSCDIEEKLESDPIVTDSCEINDGTLDNPSHLLSLGNIAQGRESFESSPDVPTSSLECVRTESSQNISISAENISAVNNLCVESDADSLGFETDNTESCTALDVQSERGGGSPHLGLDQADVGIELRRSSLDQDTITQQTASPDTTGQSETSSSAVNANSGQTCPAMPPVDNGVRPLVLDNQVPESKTTCKQTLEGDDQLLSELDAMLDDDTNATGDAPQDLPNGLRPDLSAKDVLEYKELKARYDALAERVQDQDQQIKSQQADIQDRDRRIADMRKKEQEGFQGAGAGVSQSSDDVYLAQIKGLEYTIAQQQKENKQLKDKLASHDHAAKRAISSLQNELKLRVDQVTKMYQDCQREKDQMVVKYAQAEQKNLELQKAIEKTEARVRDHVKDREVLIGKLKGFSSDKSKLSAQLQNKHAECNSVVKELDKFRDMVSSQDVKVKWAQNKLKAELESHKETKGKLEKMTIRLKEAKEETEQIRRNCQEMIKTYQTSEEIKSNSLDQQLKEKLTLMERQQQEHKDKEEVHQIVIQELDSLKRKQKDAIEEVKTLRDKVMCLEAERQSQDRTLEEYQSILQNQKSVNRDTLSRLQELEAIESEVDKTKDGNRKLLGRLEEMQHIEKETQQDVKQCKHRETELMELTQKLTNKNAHLVLENTSLAAKSTSTEKDLGELKRQCEKQEKKISVLSEELAEEKAMRHTEIDLLTKRLDEKSKLVEDLSMRVEEEKDENKTLKRRHTANMKDLTRQLQQARKKLETIEQAAGDKDSLSQGSRTSSTNSLDTMNNANGQHSSGSGGSNSAGTSRASSQEPSHPDPAEPPTVRHIEPDKQMLIERIVKVQKNLARKSEKIEFVEEHNQQLLEEIKKKSKIIQNYILREEAGALAPESMDHIKAQLSKKGGIMASVYSSHPVDGSMTMDLSLEINRKLQAVLEDTLLKNITLKENLETLGAEIARLSQENRNIQLKLKGHKS